MLSELLSQLPAEMQATIRGTIQSLNDDANGALAPIVELRKQYSASTKLDTAIEHLESLQEQLSGLSMLFDLEVDSAEPADEQPAEETTPDEKPADETPPEQPADEQPADEKPAEEKPADA